MALGEPVDEVSDVVLVLEVVFIGTGMASVSFAKSQNCWATMADARQLTSEQTRSGHQRTCTSSSLLLSWSPHVPATVHKHTLVPHPASAERQGADRPSSSELTHSSLARRNSRQP